MPSYESSATVCEEISKLFASFFVTTEKENHRSSSASIKQSQCNATKATKEDLTSNRSDRRDRVRSMTL